MRGKSGRKKAEKAATEAKAATEKATTEAKAAAEKAKAEQNAKWSAIIKNEKNAFLAPRFNTLSSYIDRIFDESNSEEEANSAITAFENTNFKDAKYAQFFKMKQYIDKITSSNKTPLFNTIKNKLNTVIDTRIAVIESAANEKKYTLRQPTPARTTRSTNGGSNNRTKKKKNYK